MRQNILLLLAALLPVSFVSCTSARQPVDGSPPVPQAEVVVRVENAGWEDATVYLLRGSARLRLGVVDGFGTRTFALSHGLLGSGQELRLAIEPTITRRIHASDTFNVSPGQTVRWSVNARSRVATLSIQR